MAPRRLDGWLRRKPACSHRQRGASTGGSAFVPGFMHGFDAKLDCLVFGERVALLYASQGFAAEGHLRHRLEQLAVAHLGATLMQTIKQLAVELDSLGWRCGHAEMVAPRVEAALTRKSRPKAAPHLSRRSELRGWRQCSWAPVPKAGIIGRKLRQSDGSEDRRRQVRHSAWECGFAGVFRLVLGSPHTREVAGSNPAAPIPKPLLEPKIREWF